MLISVSLNCWRANGFRNHLFLNVLLHCPIHSSSFHDRKHTAARACAGHAEQSSLTSTLCAHTKKWRNISDTFQIFHIPSATPTMRLVTTDSVAQMRTGWVPQWLKRRNKQPDLTQTTDTILKNKTTFLVHSVQCTRPRRRLFFFV